MQELRPQLWSWTAAHPDWKPGASWDRDVRSFAHSAGNGLVLIDPLVHEGGWAPLDGLAAAHGGVSAVAVTVHWHARSAAEAAKRYGAELFAPALGEDESLSEARPIGDGDWLPGGIGALLVEPAREALLYLSAARTLVAGDTLLARDGRLGVCPPSWLDEGEDFGEMRGSLARALELRVEAVAVSHGEPALFEGREALKQAVAAAPQAG